MFHAHSIIQHLNMPEREAGGGHLTIRWMISQVEIGALGTSLGPEKGLLLSHTFIVNHCQWVCQQLSLSCSSYRPIIFQFLATGTKRGCGEHGYVAFSYVNLSFWVDHCAHSYFTQSFIGWFGRNSLALTTGCSQSVVMHTYTFIKGLTLRFRAGRLHSCSHGSEGVSVLQWSRWR